MTLRTKTFLPLFVLSGLIFLFLYGYYSPRSVESLEQQEERATRRQLESVAQGLVPLLLAHQLDTVHENLGALLSLNENWTSLRLVDPAGRQLFPLSGAVAPKIPGSNVLVLEHQLRFRDQELGSLALTVDLSPKTAAARARHRELAAALLLVCCCYLASVWLVVDRLVRRPVGTLAHAAEQIALGDFAAPLVKTGDDEVGMLVDAFSRMRASIQGYQASLRESNRAVTDLNRELELRVADRTSRLEEANRELEAFAYTASHDLRAPLRHIGGFVALLRKRQVSVPDEEARRLMDVIASAAQGMEQLIDDLLSFSRMGRQELARMEVDLRALVSDVIGELSGDLAARAVEWRVADLPVVRGDRAMLRVLLMNLLSNALKFTQPRPSAEIEIASREGSAETVISIRDNGVGFDPRYADHIFGAFQRLHGTTEFEGTGVGLATARRIVSRHGGRIWAEGKLGEGATFHFSLPRPPEPGRPSAA